MDHGHGREDEHGTGHGHQHAMGTHGMLAVGEETIYLSHLPMFTDPAHRFQVILEVTLARDGDDPDPHAAYLADRRQSGATIYSVKPGEFDITCLQPDHPQCITSFPGSLYRNHWERPGGEEILPGLTFNVTRVVLFRDLPAPGAPRGLLDYQLYGVGPDIFLSHTITRPPDFDQTLAVRVAGDAPPADELRQGLPIIVRGRPNIITERLRAGERITGEVLSGSSTQEVELDVLAESRRRRRGTAGPAHLRADARGDRRRDAIGVPRAHLFGKETALGRVCGSDQFE